MADEAGISWVDMILDTGVSRGEEAATERLYANFQKKLSAYLRHTLGRDDSEFVHEVLMETMVRVCRDSEQLKNKVDNTAAENWVFGIARNVGYELLRMQVRMPQVPIEDIPFLVADRQADDGLLERELWALMKAAVAQQLTEAERRVFMLHWEQGMEVSAMAKLTGARLQTVKNQLTTAKRKVRRYLDAQTDVDGLGN